jgi:protein-S-isoprenylcysteine O-methyltransferase Ste14
MVLLVGAVWSVALPARRIWPPPQKHSWQYVLTWVCFYSVFALNTALFVLDWNTWIFSSELRLIIGVPFALIGGLLVGWGIATLGVRNTAGLRERFVSSGPYRFTRNPQYLGDMVLFVGLSTIANSPFLWVTHALIILVFAVTPLAEEPWLEDQYGDVYKEYRRDTSRFL